MRTRILTALVFTIAITGCQKQPEESAASKAADDTSAKAQFEQSDSRIEQFLNQLDNPDTTQDVRKQILCVDYPSEYKKNYIPALLKLSPKNYTEAMLLSDLEKALDYYKDKANIQC